MDDAPVTDDATNELPELPPLLERPKVVPHQLEELIEAIDLVEDVRSRVAC